MREESRKKVVLLLRWAVIIVTSYLILFAKGKVTHLDLGQILVLIYIATNLALTFLPKAYFFNPKLFYSLVIIDTGIVSLGMILSERVTTDFYLVFFLILIFASMSRNFKLLMTIGGITSIMYGILLYSWGLFRSENSISYILRVPFVFIMTAFYGYIVQTFTAEKRQQLVTSESKYQSLFENANEGIIILRNPGWQMDAINREVERLTGYERGELLEKFFIDLFRQEEREQVVAYLEEIFQKGEAKTDALSMLRKNGSPLEIDLSIKRVDLEGESFYQVIFRDLTEQRRLEKKIRQSKRNLEAIFDGMRDRISLQGPDFQILRVNRAVVDYHQTTFLKLMGRKCYEAYYQRSSPCERCPVATTIETRQPASSVLKIPEGDMTLRIFSYPLLDDKGQILSVIEHTRDITEEQRLQEQLIQSEKLAGIGILASGVAHEINNPLSGIIGMAEIILEGEDPSNQESYLKDILSCAQRISEIVNGLRSYSRMARGKDLDQVDVNTVLEESSKMVRLAIKPSSVEVIKQFQPVEKIRANGGEIQQVFTNLITNAFQAMGGGDGRLVLSSRPLKDMVEVKVSDNGRGIPEEHLSKIFDPFFTTKSPGEGTGLGLNIVYRILTKHAGTIEVESKEGAGTTFTVRLPIWREK